MRYNPIPKTDEDLADYRGSIVHLDAGHHLRNPTDPRRHADDREPDRHDLERGVPRRRDGPRGRPRHAAGDHRVGHARRPGASMTAGARPSTCATSTTAASRSTPRYVILRGFTLKGAGAADNTRKSADRRHPDRGRPRHRHRGLRHLRLGPAQSRDRVSGSTTTSAILSRSATLQRLIVQRCKLHHPTLRRQHVVRADLSRRTRWGRSASRCSTPRATTSSATTSAAPTWSTCTTTSSAAAATGVSAARPGPTRTSTATSSATAGTTAWRWKAAAATCASGTTTSRSP